MEPTSVDVKTRLAVHDRIAAIYADGRFLHPRAITGSLREFAIAATWATATVNKGQRVQWVMATLGLNDWAFWDIIRRDLPRYEPDDFYGRHGCEAPMIRKDGLCGKNTTQTFRVTDWATGQWRLASYCTRHRGEGDIAYRAERDRIARGVPEPTPNCGGLLPLYIGWNWLRVYKQARPSWEPPKLGIRRDDWPILEKVAGLEPPKLTVVRGQGEGGNSATPVLAVVND